MDLVKNWLRVQCDPQTKEQIVRMLADPEAGMGSVDFNAITPMPKWVYRGDLDKETIQRLGAENCWLEWCRANWGTEHNTIDPQRSAAAYHGGPVLCFVTASTPVPLLMQRLSRIWPDVWLDYLWAYEDIERGAGALQYRDGVETMRYCPKPGTQESCKLAYDILQTEQEGGKAYGNGTDR